LPFQTPVSAIVYRSRPRFGFQNGRRVNKAYWVPNFFGSEFGSRRSLMPV
jgi:hypothetical protein